MSLACILNLRLLQFPTLKLCEVVTQISMFFPFQEFLYINPKYRLKNSSVPDNRRRCRQEALAIV